MRPFAAGILSVLLGLMLLGSAAASRSSQATPPSNPDPGSETFASTLTALAATSGGELRTHAVGVSFHYAISNNGKPAAVEFPERPEPPAMGPGSPNTRFPSSRATHYGPYPGGYWIVEPTTGPTQNDPLATGPLPLALMLPGCCDSGNYTLPQDQLEFWRHVAQQGNVVVIPVYNSATVMDDIYALLQEALAELETGDHTAIDTAKTSVLGHSFGGPAAVVYAANAAAEGLPVPTAMLVANPCEGNDEGHGCVEVPSDVSLPAGIKVLVWVGDQDDIVGDEPAKRIWTALGSVPAADKDFIRAVSDDHGLIPFVADHNTIGARAPDLGVVYGLWKLFDGLTSCAFTGDFCQYALGNTPEQRFMGVWSDGTPVAELEVNDDPEAPAAAPNATPEATPAG